MMRLETERLIIRNWEDRDRELFHRINSDDDVMQFFPFRRSRAEADTFLDRIRAENEARGYGFSALELKGKRRVHRFRGTLSGRCRPEPACRRCRDRLAARP
jgi:RimJ/RimL family protein N-acetyltransferase